MTDSDVKLGYAQGRVVAKWADSDEERSFPFESIDGISVFGKAQLSTQLIRECISNNVSVGYYSDDGHYFGSTVPFGRIDPLRQKAQIYLTDNELFCVEWSRRVVSAKILNSVALLDSMRHVYDFEPGELQGLIHSLDGVQQADSVEMILGFEGNAAKCYFGCLSKLVVDEAFAFCGRSSRPPKDPFNSMISFGYSLLYRNIIGAVERHGLHPYFAYMHKPAFGHAALASDLMEEFRAPLVDKTVLEFVNSGEVCGDDFRWNDDGSVYMCKQIAKRLTDEFSRVIVTGQRYFEAYGDRKSYGFQVMIDKKIASVLKAVELADAKAYKPFIWNMP